MAGPPGSWGPSGDFSAMTTRNRRAPARPCPQHSHATWPPPALPGCGLPRTPPSPAPAVQPSRADRTQVEGGCLLAGATPLGHLHFPGTPASGQTERGAKAVLTPLPLSEPGFLSCLLTPPKPPSRGQSAPRTENRRWRVACDQYMFSVDEWVNEYVNESKIEVETHQGSPLLYSNLLGYLSPKGHWAHSCPYTHTHTHTLTHIQEKLLGRPSSPGARGSKARSPCPRQAHSRKLSASWWQSSSPLASRPPGSFTPVFRSTHQHLPRCPSRAG